MLPNQDDISFYKETIKRQAEQIQILEGKLDWFMKQQFGAGKGEQLDPNQLELDGLKKSLLRRIRGLILVPAACP
jgi:hypothetical protein